MLESGKGPATEFLALPSSFHNNGAPSSNMQIECLMAASQLDLRFALKSVALLFSLISRSCDAQLCSEYLISQLRLKTFPVASFRLSLSVLPPFLSLSLFECNLTHSLFTVLLIHYCVDFPSTRVIRIRGVVAFSAKTFQIIQMCAQCVCMYFQLYLYGRIARMVQRVALIFRRGGTLS